MNRGVEGRGRGDARRGNGNSLQRVTQGEGRDVLVEDTRRAASGSGARCMAFVPLQQLLPSVWTRNDVTPWALVTLDARDRKRLYSYPSVDLHKNATRDTPSVNLVSLQFNSGC